MGAIGIPSVLGVVVGPLIGGGLITGLDWHWVICRLSPDAGVRRPRPERRELATTDTGESGRPPDASGG